MKTRKLLLALSPYLFILPFVIFCLILLLYPVIYSLALSFRDATVETFVSGEMPFNGLIQYQAALADPIFWKALINTLLFAFLAFSSSSRSAFFWRCSFRRTSLSRISAWPHCLFHGSRPC